MADWEGFRHLAALSKSGTLSAAARLLGVEHATIARRVAALEAELGVRLVDRRGRKILLTTEGEHIAAIATRMETEALGAERLALAARSGLSGTVTLSIPPGLGAARLAEPLARLQALHPGLTFHMLGELREASLERREADIAVRLSRPNDGDLTIVRLGTIAFHFYASPAYLAETAPEDWAFIAYDGSMADAPQTRRLMTFAAGRPVRFFANTSELQLAAARAAAGIAILPDFLASGDSELSVVEDASEPLTREVWLAVHRDLRMAPAVRAVVECLKEAMKPERRLLPVL